MNNTRVKFEDRITSAHEALEAAGLNYTVEQAEIMNTATGTVSEKCKSLYRTDTNQELGIVGINYEPVQNTKAFAYFDTICEMQGAQYSEAISINNGEKVILKAEFPRVSVIGRNDEVKKQFCLINGFNGGVGVMATFMLERLVCTNGLRGLVRDAKNSFRFKHTSGVNFRMEEALKVLAAGTDYFNKFMDKADILAQKQIDSFMVDKFLREVFGDPQSKRAENKHEKVKGYIEHGVGNSGNTAWDLYNGVTEYVTHHHGKDEMKRLEYANFGGGVTLSEKAFKVAMTV